MLYPEYIFSCRMVRIGTDPDYHNEVSRIIYLDMKNYCSTFLLMQIITFCVIIINFGSSQDIKQRTPSDVLKEAIEDYNRGDFFSTVRSLEDALPVFPAEDMFEVNKYLAFSYSRIPNIEEADKHFRVLLKIRPRWRPDPEESSPEIEEIFMSTRREMSKEAGMCSCFIPGIGQMMKGENMKGIVLLAASATTFIWTITSWEITNQQHREYLAVEPGDTVLLNRTYDRYNNWYHISYVSTGVFIAVYAFTVFDAYRIRTDPRSARVMKNIQFDYTGSENGWQLGYTVRF